MTIMASVAEDGLTAAQLVEIYRRQMLIERDRLEAMYAGQIVPPEDHADIQRTLSLRLDASE